MKQMKNVSLSAALMTASSSVMAHPGHEAIGDVLHVEYLFAAGILAVSGFTAWKAIKQRL